MALWARSSFAAPVSSFPVPVASPGVDPLTGGCVVIRLNPAWLPVVIGALQQLLLQTTWKGSAEEVAQAQAWASNLMFQFNSLEPGDCSTPTPTPGIQELDYQMSICEQLRIHDGKLQGWCCGEWQDIEGQSSTGLPPISGQPGSGSDQPKSGGGTANYCGAMSGQSNWLLPTVVSSGDTLLFNNLAGAWNDKREVIWNCPDGWIYALGACGQTFPHGSPDPLPTALHMSIIALIDGNYYDVLALDTEGAPTEWTVPGGHSNSQVILMANIDDDSQVRGEVSFCVTVTNNQTGTFEHVFNFPATTGGWTPIQAGSAAWTPGVGWQDALVVTPSTEFDWIQVKRTFSARTITHFEAEYSVTEGTFTDLASTSDIAGFLGSTNKFEEDAAAGALGASPWSWDGSEDCDRLEVELYCSSSGSGGGGGGGVGVLTKVTVRGVGTDPF